MNHLNKTNSRLSSNPLPEDKEEMISLWQTTFQDSDEFADLFFNRVYKPENTLVIKSGGKIVSALQIIPYEIKTTTDIIPSAYVCGVCTLTLERGKGLMSILMNEAIDEMRQKGYGITTLIPAHPWLFDIYKKFGYIHQINYCIESYSCGVCSNKTHLSQTATIEINSDKILHGAKANSPEKPHNYFSDYKITPYTREYFHYFDKKQRERRCAVLHNIYNVENIIRDLSHDGGNAWIALHENAPVGIAFVNPKSEKDIAIKEILYDNTQAKEALIYHILNTYNGQTAKVYTPPSDTLATEVNNISNTLSSCISTKTYPYGLACILDKQITDIQGLHMTLMLD